MSAEPSLVPELSVTDCEVSVRFWRDLLGFKVLYDRPEEGFAYLALGGAHLMLDQADIGRTWRTAPFDPPLGRGINFQISVPDVTDQLRQLREAGWPLFMEPEEKWYRIGPSEEAGVRQFLVQDPDGYLLRLHMSLGHRTLEQEPNAADEDAGSGQDAAQQAEFVALRVDQDMPRLVTGLADIGQPRTQRQQPLELVSL